MSYILSKENKEKISELEALFPSVLKEGSILEDWKWNPFSSYLYEEIDGKIVGFIHYTNCYHKAEIVDFNVLEEYQNKGIGSSLMNRLLETLREEDESIENITLEVKETNEKAIYLYKKYGFLVRAKRKGYYNGVDGLLMEKEMRK